MRFVATKESVSKEAILSAFRRKEVSPEWLREVGLVIRQNEKFYIGPKLEETPKDEASR